MSEHWDAIVVGSGANGSVAAWRLSEVGMRVLLLEAGKDTTRRDSHAGFFANAPKALYRHLVRRNQDTQKHHPTFWASNPDFFVDDKANPYSTPPDMPFRWIRGRQVGGRTLTWDAVTPRLSDFEFKAASQDGVGIDWPLCHADLDRHYADLERMNGVYGAEDALPQIPDGIYAGKSDMTPGEVLFKERVEKHFPGRHVIISRGLNAERTPRKDEEHSKITSISNALARAKATGRVTLRTNAVVARVLTDPSGTTATGVEVVDAKTKQRSELRASRVFLCAGSLESVRILLNSRSPAHPRGLGGSSGNALGHYVMDHSAGNVYFTMPEVAENGASYAFSGASSIMVPRFQNLGAQTEPFLRGYGVWGGIQRMPVPGFLRKKRKVAFGFLCGRSEVLPDYDNFVEIDDTLVDAWGIPSLRIHCAWKPRDIELAEAARKETETMVREAGGEVGLVSDHFYTPFVAGFIKRIQKEWTLSTPGMFVHEVGGARMGHSAEDSVVDSYGRCWDVPNLFVTDGACWPTSGWQNPTLTQMAITSRAAERAVADGV